MRQAYFAILFTVLFNSVTNYAQDRIISGSIQDKVTRSPLPFANIGIPNKSIGTVSDQNGNFQLKLNKNITETDTLVFSFIGYITDKIPILKFKEGLKTVSLLASTEQLEEVKLNADGLKDRKLGRSSKGLGLLHYNFYSAQEEHVNDRLSKELGIPLKLHNGCRFEKFNLAVSSNEFKKLKFRLNIYHMDDEGKPDTLVVKKNIILELNDQALGWQSFDLKEYNIYLKEELGEVLLSLQWLASEKQRPSSKFFSIPVSKSPFNKVYYRNKTMNEWKTTMGRLSMYIDAKCK